VDMTVRPWRWRPSASKLGLSRAALQAFEDAATIRQALFPDGQKTMAVRFQLLPLSLDPYFTRFDLTLGGQTLEYTHGPARPVSFRWPDGSGTSSARIDYEPTGLDGRSGASVTGPWALFRLLDMGTLEKVRADRFILHFSLSGKPVSLELDAGSVINPFALTALHRFRCMDELGGAGPSMARSVARPGQG
jgi:type VI secretion system protein ImpL